MARFRPQTKVLSVTNSLMTARRLCLLWGITPYYFPYTEEEVLDFLELERKVIAQLKEQEQLQNGDRIVITHSDDRVFTLKAFDTIRVEIIKDAPPEVPNGNEELLEASFAEGKILLDTHICASCQNCIDVCPYSIWTTESSSPQKTIIDAKKAHLCTLDYTCVEECPTGAIEILSKTP